MAEPRWTVCRTVDGGTPGAQVDRPTAAHRRRPVNADGYCATCARERSQTRARRARAVRVQRTYGLSPEQHEELFRLQGGRCPHGRRITLRSPVDHDHSSGAVRGLLCDPCNRFLGYVGDSAQAFLNLWAYAARPPAIVPPVTDHEFLTHLGLFQCTHVVDNGGNPELIFCGRLEGEHR